MTRVAEATLVTAEDRIPARRCCRRENPACSMPRRPVMKYGDHAGSVNGGDENFAGENLSWSSARKITAGRSVSCREKRNASKSFASAFANGATPGVGDRISVHDPGGLSFSSFHIPAGAIRCARANRKKRRPS